MSSYTPQTNLWLERSRLDGMVLAGVCYGAFLILTIQSFLALILQRPSHGGKITDHRTALIFYIIITFILVTISTAANIKYTEMIWIDLRDEPDGPLALIQNAWEYRINVLALCCDHIQEWIMQALLRCFVIWNWTRFVTIPMVTIYVAMIGLSIGVQVESSTSAKFYDLNTELAYFCVQVGHTVLYTILIVYRLLSMRSRLNQVMPVGGYNSGPYDTIILMIVESAMAFTILALIFIFAFGFDNDGLSTLSFLCIGKVQGITQLFIILHVARGRAVTQEWWTRADAAPTTLMFAGARPGATKSQDEGMSEPEEVADGTGLSVV